MIDFGGLLMNPQVANIAKTLQEQMMAQKQNMYQSGLSQLTPYSPVQQSPVSNVITGQPAGEEKYTAFADVGAK